MGRAARDHMGRVASLGCILCRRVLGAESPAEVHHVFDTPSRSDFLTIPLCHYHHRGGGGFHTLGQREFERQYKTTEAKLLAMTIEELHA